VCVREKNVSEVSYGGVIESKNVSGVWVPWVCVREKKIRKERGKMTSGSLV